jgi:hypothetical protein
MLIRLIAMLLLLSPGVVDTRAAPRRDLRKDKNLKGGRVSFEQNIEPLLSRYCFDCHGKGKHKGDLALDAYQDVQSILNDRKTWEKVLHNVRAHVMPPEKKLQPPPAERELIANWIESEIFKCDCTHPDPGRVTIRRLNRAEYNNTIRDLVGVKFQPADDFPSDDTGYGFDNIGDVLSMPPILLEKYLAAAEKILDQAMVLPDSEKGRPKRFAAAALEGTAPGEPLGGGARSLTREGDIHVEFNFARPGEYILRAKAWGEQAGPEPPRMTFSLAGKELKTFDVEVVEGAAKLYEVRLAVEPGKKPFAAAYINNYFNAKEPDSNKRDRNLIIEYLEIVEAVDGQPARLSETQQRIFICRPSPGHELDCARTIIANFAQRAYRRRTTAAEVDRLVKIAELALKDGESFEYGIKLALEAVLVSPHFLFRGEFQPEPGNPNLVYPIDEFALATRLSYFVWSSMPDDELLELAGRGLLRKNLEAEVRRMLKDPKARALVENFAGQWLQTRNLKLVSPDPWQYPEFDEELRVAMQKETELLFEMIMREDRSVIDFIDADYTYINQRLAQHYGIPGVKGEEFQRVSLKDAPRGGVLTHASVLTITSNPTRTSPVKRGKWVLENILGTPPPPPPPDVPELKEGKEAVLSGSLRQRMEQHRAGAICASCHAQMDPIGFGLENFNGLGGWREQDGKFPIDPSGTLPSGQSFKGPADLQKILLSRKNDFVRCLSEKMLTYALGRGTEYYDKCALEEISKGVAKNKYTFSSLVFEIVKSTPFQMRRGEGERLAVLLN